MQVKLEYFCEKGRGPVFDVTSALHFTALAHRVHSAILDFEQIICRIRST